MCTIHVLQCPTCKSIPSALRQPCPSTPAYHVCHAGLTTSITTYLHPGHCETCLFRTGPYENLPQATPPLMPALPLPRATLRSSFESLSSTRRQRYEWRVRTMWRRSTRRARSFCGVGPERHCARKEGNCRGWEEIVGIKRKESKHS
ncbi:hypothetical protein C8035_v011170 [Colletotrichum spinosum]|uniref:Uncharacterized protein n=1 Tax=Colletotrichum spinosum TaxID=1347390 RepID=A0A4R8PUY2_9PEZI|nr:hypothetical protein C8035_v011170 [Colletotrichum spinosum]